MLTSVVKKVKVIISLVLAIIGAFSPAFAGSVAPIERAKDGCKSGFAVISDTHIKANFLRQGMLELGLADMEKATDKLDALVINGDITDSGHVDMWDTFADAMLKYDVAKQTVLVEGNHDVRGPKPHDMNTVRQLFTQYNKKISNRDVTQLYYTTTIAGYPAIILSGEEDQTSAYITDEQVEWFAAEMEKASKTGLPIFVFLHQSINGTHGLPYTWEMNKHDVPERGGIGEKSDEILAIIKQYKNVFYISGHIHAGFANEDSRRAVYTSVEQHDGYTLINLPSYMYADFTRGGFLSNGTGYVFEIYENEVMIRARNFATGRWVPKYDVTVPLSK